MTKKHFLQFTVLIAFVTALLLFVSNILCYQCSSDEMRLKLFYNEKENSMNLMLFGASSVRTGFIPTKAYENYGVTSYDYTINYMPLPTTKYLIAEALEYQSPEIIMIDINGITYCNESFTETKSPAFTDTIRNGKNRSNAVKSVYKGKRSWEDDISFIKYHKNIFRIGSCLTYASYYQKFGSKTTVLKGYTSNPTAYIDYSKVKLVKPNTIKNCAEFNDYENETVNELLNYCESIKDDVKIIFTRFPRLTIKNDNEWEIPYINSFVKKIEERGFDFVDFYYHMNNFNIDLSIDFSDYTHLNIFGAEKFTDYLCSYLISNYSLTNNIKDEKWDMCVEYSNLYYEDMKESTRINEHKEFNEFDFAKSYNIYGI